MQKLKLNKEPDLTLKHSAFAYQLEAVNAVKDLEYAAVFHEQGLGKTKVAIDLIVYWLSHRLLDTALIVVKKGLLDNWQRELASHSQLTPRILSNNRMSNFYVFNSPARVVLAHYEAVKADEERIRLFLKTRERWRDPRRVNQNKEPRCRDYQDIPRSLTAVQKTSDHVRDTGFKPPSRHLVSDQVSRQRCFSWQRLRGFQAHSRPDKRPRRH